MMCEGLGVNFSRIKNKYVDSSTCVRVKGDESEQLG